MLDDSRIWVNDALWKLWSWCVREAKYTEESSWITINTGRGETEIEIKKGQFVFGRHSASKQLRVPESTLWKRMKKLQKLGYLNIESNSHFSIVTVVEPDEAKMGVDKRNIESNKPRTSQEQASNTTKKLKTIKNVEKEDNPFVAQIFNYWNSLNGPVSHKNLSGFKGTISARLDEGYSTGEIMDAMCNYAKILNDPNYTWSYRYTLAAFLERKTNNLDRFATKNDPFSSMPKVKGAKKEDAIAQGLRELKERGKL